MLVHPANIMARHGFCADLTDEAALCSVPPDEPDAQGAMP